MKRSLHCFIPLPLLERLVLVDKLLYNTSSDYALIKSITLDGFCCYDCDSLLIVRVNA